MTGDRRTWSLEEFQGGIDLRDGQFSANQTRFRELTNVWVTKGKKLARRPPCIQTSGDLSPASQGLVSIDGRLYAFAKKGDGAVHSGDVATQVQVLEFDNPDYCTGWDLIAAGVFDGYAAAWILHDYPSTAYPKVAMLHVWDGLLYAPTFVQDPYLPGSFSPSIADLTDQKYEASFRPVLGQGATKLWTSTNRGNAHCCRTADARVWNQRTKDSLLEDGEHWCFIVPEGVAVREFIVPRNADWLTGEGRWAYYVCERNVGGSWVPMEEATTTPTANFTWQPVSVPSRFSGGWNEIKVVVKWGDAPAGLIRLRLVAGATSLEVTQTPTVEALAGSGGAGKLKIGSAKFRYRGGDGQVDGEYITADMVANKVYLLSVSSNDLLFPRLLNLTDSGFPNGWGREHRQFIKRITAQEEATGNTEWEDSWTPEWVPMTGLVDINGTSITGNATPDDTKFNSELTVIGGYYGDRVRVGGNVRQIAAVYDDVNASVTTSWGTTLWGAVIEKGYCYALYSGGKTQVRVDNGLAAQLLVGNVLRINSVLYKVSDIDGRIITITDMAGADGDFVEAVGKLQTVYKTNAPIIKDYQYAFQANADSSWYTDRVVDYVDQAGAEDALSIASAAHDNTGGTITSITSVRQRMLITYPGSMQLWAIDQDTNRTAYLDTMAFGTGDQPTPPVVPWYGSLVLPVTNGIRAISVVGANTDNLQDLNIGEPIEDLEVLVASAAQFWPLRGQVLIAGTTGEGLEFRCLDYSRESKITAWSRWLVTGIASVDPGTMVADGTDCWFRSGNKLWRFDASATIFRDSGETAGNAYASTGLFHLNDMGKPGQAKRFTAMDIVQVGTCSLSFVLPPYGASFAALNSGPLLQGPTIEGITYGRSRLPLAMVAAAVAPRFTSRDETGWEMHRLSLDFLLLRR